MVRFATLAVALILAVTTPGVCAEDSEAVKLLRKEIELLTAKLEAANLKIEKLEKENQQLRTGGKDAAPEGKRTLSDRLIEGAVCRGDFVTTNLGKDNSKGTVSLTITERKGNSFKGKFAWVQEGKPETEFEVSGMISGSNFSGKSINAPNAFTLNGQFRNDYLHLQYTGPFTKANGTLKVQ